MLGKMFGFGRTRARREKVIGVREARELNAIAGSTLSRGSATRRGNVLVLVLGTLALMSVLAAVYVTTGTADRRTAAAVERQVEVAEVGGFVGEYLAGVIRDDLFSSYVAETGPAVTDRSLRRETFDFPWTDWTVSSNPDEFNGPRFDPTGSHADTSISVGFRVPYDPWLASTEPTFLGRMGLPGVGLGDRLGSSLTERWLDNRDWWQISNFAPDGRFVNLFNLRGNFDAEPGIGITPNPAGGTRMSEGLTLYELDGNGVPQVSLDRVDGLSLGNLGNGTTTRNTTDPDALARPANWTMLQRGALIPAAEPIVFRGGDAITWDDFAYPLYQWADADGDGLLDSRWFELATVFDEDELSYILPPGEIRYFVAARAMDLSSLVNVNIATDGLTPAVHDRSTTPDAPSRLGATPAEIDLRRLLMMTDAAERATSVSTLAMGEPLGLRDIEAGDRLLTVGEDYTGADSSIEYDVTVGNAGVTQAIGAMGYDALGRALQGGSPPAPLLTGPQLTMPLSGPPAMALEANSRYDQLGFLTASEQLIRSSDIDGFASLRAQRRHAGYFTAADAFQDTYVDGSAVLGPNEANPCPTTGLTDFDEVLSFTNSFFGAEDLEELLVRRGVNDPNWTTRLELTIDGRFNPSGNLDDTDGGYFTSIGPMRSARGLAVEMEGRDGNVYPSEGLYPADDVPDGALDADALAQLTLDVRSRITTMSGHRPIRPGAVGGAGQTVRTKQFLTNASSGGGVFLSFVDALAPGLAADTTLQFWDSQVYTSTDATVYGYRGPELALNIAAHMAANSSNASPRPHTLILDNGVRNALNQDLLDSDNPSDGAVELASRQYPSISWADSRADGREYDLDPGANDGNATDILPTNNADGVFPVVDVFPIVAQPMITSVASFTVYTDSSSERQEALYDGTVLTSSEDYVSLAGSEEPIRQGVTLPPDVNCNLLRRTTIDARIGRQNGDLVFSLLAIQLHNPFNEPIILWNDPVMDDSGAGGTEATLGNTDINDVIASSPFPQPEEGLAGRSEDYFYLEYQGKFYELAAMRDRSFVRDSDTAGLEPWDVRGAAGVSPDDISGSAAVNPALNNQYLNLDSNGAVSLSPIVIFPNSSVVVYALSERPRAVARRLHNASTRSGSGTAASETLPEIPDDAVSLNAWISAQLDGTGVLGVHQIPRVSIGSAGFVFDEYLATDTDFNDPLEADATLVDPAGANVINLWRSIRAAGDPDAGETDPSRDELQEEQGITFPGTTWFGTSSSGTVDLLVSNDRRNDQLVDRFRFDGADINRRLPRVVLEVEETGLYPPVPDFSTIQMECPTQTDGWDESLENSIPLARLNRGYTIMTWGEVGRRAGDVASQDGMPFYAIEPKRPIGGFRRTAFGDMFDVDVDGSVTEIRDMPFDDLVGSVEQPLNGAINPRGSDGADLAPHFWLAQTAGANPIFWMRELAGLPDPGDTSVHGAVAGGGAVSDQISVAADARTGGFNNAVNDYAGAAFTGDEFGPFGSLTARGVDRDIDTVLPDGTDRPELDASRLADLLQRLGIGPRRTPYTLQGGTLTDVNDRDIEWTTLAEALAVAFNYENAVDPMAPAESTLLYGFEPSAGVSTTPMVLDQGRPRLNDFVPFYDSNTNGQFDPSSDLRVGLGLPPALALLDHFTAISDRDGNPSSDRPIYGTVNINTASDPVLRVLGLLTPSLARQNIGGTSDLHDYWPLRRGVELGQGGTLDTTTATSTFGLPVLTSGAGTMPIDASNVLSVSPAMASDIPDVAATVSAYRDLMWGDYRPASIASGAGSLGGSDDAFFGYPAGLGASDATRLLESNFLDATATSSGRDVGTGVAGLRNTPGFSSLGELLAVTVPDDDGGALPNAFDDVYSGLFMNGREGIEHLMIDYLGYDEQLDGTTPRALGPELESQLDLTSDADDTANEFDERLAMANSVFNVASVSSDFYAVWFVVHGYRADDVEGLGASEPMTPSVARRYLMVVDRSVVTRETERPRIVLFRELPF